MPVPLPTGPRHLFPAFFKAICQAVSTPVCQIANCCRSMLPEPAFSTTGLPLTVKATIDATHETFTLKVRSPGGTNLDYTRDAKGKRTVTGTYFGKTVSLKG